MFHFFRWKSLCNKIHEDTELIFLIHNVTNMLGLFNLYPFNHLWYKKISLSSLCIPQKNNKQTLQKLYSVDLWWRYCSAFFRLDCETIIFQIFFYIILFKLYTLNYFDHIGQMRLVIISKISAVVNEGPRRGFAAAQTWDLGPLLAPGASILYNFCVYRP